MPQELSTKKGFWDNVLASLANDHGNPDNYIPSDETFREGMKIPGMVKQGYQEIDKSLGLPVSSPEQEAANRDLFKEDGVTGNTQAAIADVMENPSITNAMGLPLAA